MVSATRIPRFLRRFTVLAVFGTTLFTGQILIACDNSSGPGEAVDPKAQIIIQYPKGGETFKVGDVVDIKWTTQGEGVTDVNAVNIEVSPDSGRTWATLLGRSVSLEDDYWGKYPWTVPESVTKLGVSYPMAGNAGLRIKISQYVTADTNKIAVMKKPFSVVAR